MLLHSCTAAPSSPCFIYPNLFTSFPFLFISGNFPQKGSDQIEGKSSSCTNISVLITSSRVLACTGAGIFVYEVRNVSVATFVLAMNISVFRDKRVINIHFHVIDIGCYGIATNISPQPIVTNLSLNGQLTHTARNPCGICVD